MRFHIEPFVRVIIISLLLVNTAAAAEESAPQFSAEQLEQLTAPIALYPDTLLSQILMAATYPADIVDAAKWSTQNPDAKGDDAVRTVESQPWDPSVKSLVAFPQVLAMMSAKPEWVQNLGDAFLASSKDVLDAVQRLRTKAQQAGNLQSNEQQKIVVKEEPAQPQVIVIEAADPQVVYVPSYNPTVVYGAWPYPAYPPYYYPPPPAYYPGAALASGIAFGIGVAAVGSLWGDCNWGGGDVDIDVDRHNNINVNNRIDKSQKNFQHNAANRRGVPYRDSRSQQKYGRDVPGASQRENFRGRDSRGDGARDTQRQRAQSTLSQRGMDPARGRDELRNNPQARERAENAARDSNRERSRSDNAFGDRGGRDRDSMRQNDRARGSRDSAFRDAGNADLSRRQADRGNFSRQRSGGGGGRSGGGGGRRR